MNRVIRNRVGTGLIAFAMVLAQVLLPVSSAFASELVYETPTGGMISLCHRSNAANNPYQLITVNTNAADGVAGSSGGQSDHYGEHKGPIASSEAVAQGFKDQKPSIEWGDIIPPIPGVHDGLNWSAVGQAMLRNGCNFVTSDASANVVVTPPSCAADGSAAVNDFSNATLIGTLDQSVGTHTATFAATTGHLFTGDTSTKTVVYTILAQLTGEQCENPSEPTKVTPNVTVIDKCGTDDDSVNGRATEGITYIVTENGLSYTVIASPSSSEYELLDGNGFTLNLNGTATYTTTLTNVACDMPAIPAAPSPIEKCGILQDMYIIPSTPGVDYLIDGEAIEADEYSTGGVLTVTVNAEAQVGYVLTGTHTWTLTFTNEICPRVPTVCVDTSANYNRMWFTSDTLYPEAGARDNDEGDYNGLPIAWSNAPGTFNFKNDGLYLSTPGYESYVKGFFDAGATPLTDVDAMSYRSIRHSASAGYFEATHPAYVLMIDTNGLNEDGGIRTLFYEPYNNDQPRATIEDEWQLWDTKSGGNAKWWMNGTGQALNTWNHYVTEYQDAVVLGYGFNQGTWNPETYSAVQTIVFDCKTTTFSKSDDGGQGGGDTKTPPGAPAAPVLGGKGALLPEELPMTGENGSIVFTWIALLAAVLTYGAVYYLQPKKRFEQ